MTTKRDIVLDRLRVIAASDNINEQQQKDAAKALSYAREVNMDDSDYLTIIKRH